MKRIITFISLLLLLIPTVALADVTTDKQMSRVKRSDKVLWGESRSESEETARQEALSNLIVKVTEYLNAQKEEMPESVLMPKISSVSECLTSHSSRWHVLVYVNKADLLAIDGNNGVLLTRDESKPQYQPANVAPIQGAEPEPTVEENIDEQTEAPKVITEVRPMSPTLSTIANTKNKEQLQAALGTLKKHGSIGGAAMFPIAKANDYYVYVIDGAGNQVALLHYLDGQWLNAYTNEPHDISIYVNCTGYWFTLNE